MTPVPTTLHDEILNVVATLDMTAGAQLIRDLLYAEAHRHSINEQMIEQPSDVHVPDGGIDAETKLTFEIPPLKLPSGWHVWQIKTGAETPTPSTELRSRANVRDVRDAIAEGADYVLVWTVDTPGTFASRRQSAFLDEVRRIRKTTRVYVVLATNVATWVEGHFNLVGRLVRFEGFDPVRGPTGLEVRNGTTAAERSIEQHLMGELPTALRVIGPPGVGKSTAIVLAAQNAAVELPTFVAPRMSETVRETIARLARARLHVGLVVEDCPAHEAAALERHVEESAGALRLVTEYWRDDPARFRRTTVLTLESMMPYASREVLEKLGVNRQLVEDLVRQYGFNTELLATAATGTSEDVERTLASLLEGINNQGALALAVSVCELEDRGVLDTISSQFGVDVPALEDAAWALHSRGLVRSPLSPRLPSAVATHIAREAISRRPATVRSLVDQLDDIGVAIALIVIGPCGPIAQHAVDELLTRFPDPDVDLSETHHGWDLESWLTTVGAGATASPIRVAERFKAGAQLIRWHEPHLVPAYDGLAQVIATVCLGLHATERDGAAGVTILLEIAAAAGPNRTLDRAIASLLQPDRVARHGDPFDALLSIARLLGPQGTTALLRAAGEGVQALPALAHAAMALAAEDNLLRPCAAQVVSAGLAGGNTELVPLIHDPMWTSKERAQIVAGYASGGGDVTAELKLLEPSVETATIEELIAAISSGQRTWAFRGTAADSDRQVIERVADALKRRADVDQLLAPYRREDGWVNQLTELERRIRDK